MRSFDVVVVGGGIAGVSVAAAVAPHARVALIEAEAALAHHTTGRSAAAFLESYGSSEIRRLTGASRIRLDEVTATTGHAILSPRPLLWIAREDQASRLDGLCGTVPSLWPLDAAAARQKVPALRAGHVAAAALEPGAQDIDVLALHQHYVRTARRHDAVFLRRARLRGADRRRELWRLQIADGTEAAATLEAPTLVDAAGAWADEVTELLGGGPIGLRPLRRTVAIARTRGRLDPGTPLIADVDERFYFKPEGPNVLVSPADETPSDPCDARPDELDVALALERVNAATTLDLRSIVSAWAGLRTFAADRNPVVGPDPAVPGLVWCAGQGGYGIQTAPAIAAIVAHLVVGTPVPDGLDTVVEALAPTRFATPGVAS